jgi:DGQHR domain-containing protein
VEQRGTAVADSIIYTFLTIYSKFNQGEFIMKTNILKRPAIQIEQKNGRKLFAFGIDGKKLTEITQISRLGRGPDSGLVGYQRPEVVAHIGQIRSFLEADNAMLPNAIVVAFDSRVRFETIPGSEVFSDRNVQLGVIEIPVDLERRPGWIVDGQQRAAAIRDADLESFHVFVTAFITDDIDEQRSQFILVNSTKPLPKGLIYELLPETETNLPPSLERKRMPARLLHILNCHDESVFKGRIMTPTNPGGNIKDNSVLRMLENSLSDGALYRVVLTGSDNDVEKCVTLLNSFWAVVAAIFPEEWRLAPNRSRLTHGAGIATMGHLMDVIASRYRKEGPPSSEQFQENLAPLKSLCCWTSGHWDFGMGIRRKWNEIQNTSKDIQLLANFLLVQYKTKVWNA